MTAGDAHATLCQTGGDLERIRRIGRLEGYIHCAPGFRDHPKVLDGVSDLLLKVFEARQTCAHRLGDSGHAVKRLHPTRRLGRSVRLEAPVPTLFCFLPLHTPLVVPSPLPAK